MGLTKRREEKRSEERRGGERNSVGMRVPLGGTGWAVRGGEEVRGER